MSDVDVRRVVDALPVLRAADLKMARRVLAVRWGLSSPVSELEMATMLGISHKDNYTRHERFGAEATGPMSTAVRAMLSGYRPPNAPVED